MLFSNYCYYFFIDSEKEKEHRIYRKRALSLYSRSTLPINTHLLSMIILRSFIRETENNHYVRRRSQGENARKQRKIEWIDLFLLLIVYRGSWLRKFRCFFWLLWSFPIIMYWTTKLNKRIQSTSFVMRPVTLRSYFRKRFSGCDQIEFTIIFC